MDSSSDWAALYNDAPCGLARFDSGFRILSANRYFLELVGVSDEQAIIGTRFQDFLSVAGRIYLQTRLHQELSLTGRMEELALDIVAQDGARTPTLLNITQRFDASRRPSEIHIAIGRAAAKRAYEAEVPKARLAADQALRIKADLLANLSHEMRTPLNGVVGLASVLGATALDPEQRQMVADIRTSGESLSRLVEDLLDLANVRAGTLALVLRPFDLADALDGVIDTARLRAEAKGLGFELERASIEQARYVGDPVRLKQVVEILLSNAVKFTTAGGVRLRLDRDAAGGVLITVTDTGIGFPEALAPQLFEDFGQADTGLSREAGGVGIGLPVAKALIDLMDGQIAVSSQVGMGSTFEVRLPLEPCQPAVEPAAVEVEDERPLRILLVEDNPTNQKVVQLILSALDVELVIADNGALGIEAWRGGGFDLVLMDIQMPVMDGLTAIRVIRASEAEKAQPRTPIIVLSANAMDQHRREAADAGADAHLAKPVSADTLISGISAALQEIPPEEIALSA